MKTFLRGNVIKSPNDHVEIVIRSEENKLETIPIDYPNSGSHYKYEDRELKKRCHCNGGCGNDPECLNCKGTGEYIYIVRGYKHATFLARTVKDYILQGLTKNFNF